MHVFQSSRHPSICKPTRSSFSPSAHPAVSGNTPVRLVNGSLRCINPVKVGKMVADFFIFWGVRRGGWGGSKCQLPLGSGDGGYIYQSKQPRGAEYFTCRGGLLHYHVHWSYSIYFKYSLFKIHANIQCAKWWWWW